MGYSSAQRLSGAQDHTKLGVEGTKAYTAKVNKPPDAKTQLMSGLKKTMGNIISKSKGANFDD